MFGKSNRDNIMKLIEECEFLNYDCFENDESTDLSADEDEGSGDASELDDEAETSQANELDAKFKKMELE